jgi:hypothetical protein
MGPYCKFCDTRCFCYFPQNTPTEILEAYGTSTIIATCPAGQAFEKKQTGYNYDMIKFAVAHVEALEQVYGDKEPA